MTEGYKLYKTDDFIKMDKEGVLDLERSKKIVRELAATAGYHKDHNLLIDMRNTEISLNLTDIMKVVLEFYQYKNLFKNKLAVIIPDKEERIKTAEMFRVSMGLKEFDYKYFVDFEKAIDYLSTIEHSH
jgi:hypothetical protein